MGAEVALSCLLFGEIRALLSNQDALEVRTDIGGCNGLSSAQLWSAIDVALSEQAMSCKLDERRRALLREVFLVSMLAVNDEFVDVSPEVRIAIHLDRLPSIAIIPPVSGG